MRQLGTRRAVSLAAVFAGVIGLTAACGQEHAGAGASGGSTPAAQVAVCASPASAVSAAHPLTLTAKDNGRTICVTRGSGVFVYLHGTAAHKWTPIRSSTGVLVPKANGRMILALGVTGGYFVADHSGSASLSSSRTPCLSGTQPTAATSGPQCSGPTSVFRVTLVVTG